MTTFNYHATPKVQALNNSLRKQRAVPLPVHNEHHISVRDESAEHGEEPLSAFMVSPKYLDPEVVSRMTPQARSISSNSSAKEPATFHHAIAAPMALERIRRPRNITKDEDFWADDTYAAKGTKQGIGSIIRLRTAFVAAAVMVGAKISDAWAGLHRAFHAHRLGRRTHYSVADGSDVQRFGVPTTWWKTLSVATLILALLGVGIFYRLVGFDGGGGISPHNPLAGNESSNNQTGGGSTPTGNGSNSGTTANGTAANSSGAGSAVNGVNPQSSSNKVQAAAIGTPLQTASGSAFSPSIGGSTGATGGRGGGTSPAPSTSSGGTGGGSGSSPSTPSSSNPSSDPLSDSSLNKTSGGLLPVTTTVPAQNISSGDKTIVKTSPTTVTLN